MLESFEVFKIDNLELIKGGYKVNKDHQDNDGIPPDEIDRSFFLIGLDDGDNGGIPPDNQK